MSPITQGALVILVAVFLLAAIEKAQWVARRAEPFHPALLGLAWLASTRRVALRASLTADVGVVVLLAVAGLSTSSQLAATGATLAFGLLAIYTVVGLWATNRIGELARSEGCHCLAFGLLEVRTSAGLLVRNGVFALTAAVASNAWT